METENLITVALENKHTEFEIITNMGMYNATKVFKSASKKIAAAFKHDSEELLKKYIENIKNGIDDLHTIFQYKILLTCAEFYEKEVDTAELMMYEYQSYLLGGHLIRALLGEERQVNESNNGTDDII